MDAHRQSDEGTPGSVPRLDDQSSDTSSHAMPHWLMIMMCVPMAIVALVLVATGVVGAGVLLAVVGCVAMMAVMMRMMGSH